jgi:hypothetical protein
LKASLLVALLGTSFALCFAADPPKYTGPGSCASPSCHGGVAPRSDNSVWQNEYSTWVVKDKHSQAFTALSLPVAVRMAKILGLPNAFSAPKCLACHALDVPEAERARTFDASDGVSCENCHGPASNWLGPHTTKAWTHQQSVDAGMYDTRDVVHRSEKCLTCHLGTPQKFVDHEMIAAGHPDLYFELASFQAVMPKHWRERSDFTTKDSKDDPWADVRALAVGQAVQLREQFRRVARYAQGPNVSEYSVMDCFACHHSLTSAQDSWRQELGYQNRKPGSLTLNLSSVTLLALFGNSDADYRRLTTELIRLAEKPVSPDPQAIEAADRVAQRIATMKFDPASTLAILKHASSSDVVANLGERPAEQITMAIDTLFVAYSRATKVDNSKAVQDAIHGLFKLLEDPSSYNAPKFAQQMRVVNGLLK